MAQEVAGFLGVLLGFNASATARVIYQGGEMMMKSVFWWRKPEYPEETTDLWQL